MSTLGHRLRTIREAKGTSLADLSAASGVTKAYLVGIEHDRKTNLTLGTVRALADALGVAPAWLAFGRLPEVAEDRVLKLASVLNAEPGLRIDYVKAMTPALPGEEVGSDG